MDDDDDVMMLGDVLFFLGGGCGVVGEWLVSGCFKFTMESRKVLVWGFGSD